jgi:ketosteroid isomerase-like protein
LLDPNMELQTPGGPRLCGHDQARDWFGTEYEHVKPRIIPERFVGERDVVAGFGTTQVRRIESGEIAESDSAAVFWFRNGKIVRWQPFETHDAALEGCRASRLGAPVRCSRLPRYRCPVSGQRVPGGVVHTLPADLREALIANTAALDAWKDITPLARNEFICWVENAKQQRTRERRIRRTKEELEEGQRRPCCWPGCTHRDRAGS